MLKRGDRFKAKTHIVDVRGDILVRKGQVIEIGFIDEPVGHGGYHVWICSKKPKNTRSPERYVKLEKSFTGIYLLDSAFDNLIKVN